MTYYNIYHTCHEGCVTGSPRLPARLIPLCRPLSSRSHVIFMSITEVFDAYFLSCFILFSGISLETLVFQVSSLNYLISHP